MATKEELIKKWDLFLSKIEERFNLIIEQAQIGTDSFIEQLEYDSISVTNAWSGIKGQLYSLSEKVTNTWDDKMDDLFGDRDDVTSEERIEQYNKYTDLNHKMSVKYESESTLALAKAGQKIYENVMAHIDVNKIHNCKQCGDKMNIKVYSFMAKNIKCQSCGTVNSYEPDARILALEFYTINAFASKLVIPLVEKEANINNSLSKLDYRIKEEKIKIDAFRIDLEKTMKDRISQYYDFISSNIPDKKEFYDRKKEERITWAENNK